MEKTTSEQKEIKCICFAFHDDIRSKLKLWPPFGSVNDIFFNDVKGFQD